VEPAKCLKKAAQELTKGLISQYSAQFAVTLDGKHSMPRLRPTIGSTVPLRQIETFSVLLTGSTGILGSHILVSFLAQEHVDKIYCLLRSSSPADPYKSVIGAAHGNDRTKEAVYSRVRFVNADVASGPELGLQLNDQDEMRNTVRLIIHCGWAVNSNIPLESFAPLFEGTVSLLKLCSTPGSGGMGADWEPKFGFHLVYLRRDGQRQFSRLLP
jgi:hypothetical protein